jgi:hypothetical protein
MFASLFNWNPSPQPTKYTAVLPDPYTQKRIAEYGRRMINKMIKHLPGFIKNTSNLSDYYYLLLLLLLEDIR